MNESKEPKLTSKELLLLSFYRQAGVDGKEKIIQAAELIAQKDHKKDTPRNRQTIQYF